MTKDSIIYYGSQFNLDSFTLGDAWASNRAAQFDEVEEQVMGSYMPDYNSHNNGYQPSCYYCIILPKISGIKYSGENLIAEGTRWIAVYAYYPDLVESVHGKKDRMPYSTMIDNYIKAIEAVTGHDFLSTDFELKALV